MGRESPPQSQCWGVREEGGSGGPPGALARESAGDVAPEHTGLLGQGLRGAAGQACRTWLPVALVGSDLLLELGLFP